MSDDDFVSDLVEAAGDGCLWGLIEVLPLRWILGITAACVVLWLLFGHPGWAW